MKKYRKKIGKLPIQSGGGIIGVQSFAKNGQTFFRPLFGAVGFNGKIFKKFPKEKEIHFFKRAGLGFVKVTFSPMKMQSLYNIQNNF